jgi:hypothetical protein
MSKVLQPNGQYTDDFLKLLDTVQPHMQEVRDAIIAWLVSNGAPGMDYRIAYEFIADEWRSDMMSRWMEVIEKAQIDDIV